MQLEHLQGARESLRNQSPSLQTAFLPPQRFGHDVPTRTQMHPDFFNKEEKNS